MTQEKENLKISRRSFLFDCGTVLNIAGLALLIQDESNARVEGSSVHQVENIARDDLPAARFHENNVETKQDRIPLSQETQTEPFRLIEPKQRLDSDHLPQRRPDRFSILDVDLYRTEKSPDSPYHLTENKLDLSPEESFLLMREIAAQSSVEQGANILGGVCRIIQGTADIVGGTETGLKIGALGGPYSAGVGAAVGALVGTAKAMKTMIEFADKVNAGSYNYAAAIEDCTFAASEILGVSLVRGRNAASHTVLNTISAPLFTPDCHVPAKSESAPGYVKQNAFL